MKRLKIAYITVTDARSKRTWSGTNYYLMQSISDHVGEVEIIGPLSAEPYWTFCRFLNFVSLKLFGKRFNYRDSAVISKAYSQEIKKRLEGKTFDLIIAPAGTSTLAFLETDIPMVYINDRCVAGALEYHEILRNLWKRSEKESIHIESLAVSKSLLTVYSSGWAADASKQTFRANADKIHVIPFGANLDVAPNLNELKVGVNKKIKLLFVGVKWLEKGGDIAFETLKVLHAQNIDAELVICGCTPPDDVRNDPGVITEGFLNKEIPEDFNRLRDHFATSDFLIVPTRFEAYGLVFCEAAAYALPVLATNTGGIPEIVLHNITGCLFRDLARGDAYAKKIIELKADPQQLLNMKKAARKRYDEVLNWKSFGEKLRNKIDSALQVKK